MSKDRKRVTIKDVAKEGSVSYSAVSAVLNNKLGKNIRVGENTQKRIWAAAKSLGYTPNLSAQSLAKGRNDILSVFTYEPIFPFSSESEFYPFLLGIEQEAENHELDLLMITNRKRQSSSNPTESGIARLQIADGGILIGIRRDEKTIEKLIMNGFPLVIIGRREFKQVQPYYVTFDYISIIEEIIDFVYKKGHRNVVYIRKGEDFEMLIDRENALNVSCNKRNGMSVSIHNNDARQITTTFLQSLIHNNNTLFMTDDFTLAEGIQAAFDELGLTVGKDISTIFLNDFCNNTIKWACWSSVRRIIGIEAVTMLCKLIEGEKPISPVLIKPQFIKRNTIADLNKI